MEWKDIVSRDAYLAGSIAARGHEASMEEIAESEAASVGLTGEARLRFLRGWNYEVAQYTKKRHNQLIREYDEVGKDAAKGDPAR